MKVSLKWINEKFIKTTLSPSELESHLTGLGLECSYKKLGIDFTDVVLGKVVDCKKHPDADRLSICKVDIGEAEDVQVVCGAPNVKKNIFVPLAKVGATLKNKDFLIKKTKIRGVYSWGMICSGKELSFNNDNEGILIVQSKGSLGTSIEKILDFQSDAIFDIDLTPNRGDCLSHLGVAREISIIENKKIDFSLNEELKKVDKLKNYSIKNHDLNACKRYTASVIRNIKVKESPKWLINYLTSIGLRSKNNIVDITNFIMMNYGIPIHAFDADKIKHSEINVRFAKNNESICTIDGQKIKLNNENLIIADAEMPIAIAGVMGGLNSCVTDETKNVLLECAYFDPICIRKSSKICNISSDSSRRFERNVDIEILPKVLYEAYKLILEYTTDSQDHEFVDLISLPNSKHSIIEFNSKDCNAFLGSQITNRQICEIFNALNFKVEDQGNNNFNIIIPSYRSDLKNELDLYEEVARVYGYDNIPSSKIAGISYRSFQNDIENSIEKVRSFLSLNGYNEHMSNSLIPENEARMFSQNYVKLLNHSSIDMSCVRNSIAPGILKAVSYNQKRKKTTFKFFEIGKINNRYGLIYKEEAILGIAWNSFVKRHWKGNVELDFYSAKGQLEYFFKNFKCDCIIKKKQESSENFELLYEVILNHKKIGFLGKPSRELSKMFDLKNPIFYCEIKLDNFLRQLDSMDKKYIKPSTFPYIDRDISLEIDISITTDKVIKVIEENGSNLLKKVELFDIFNGNKIENGKQSLAFSLIFQSRKKTLKDQEVDLLIEKIINKLENKFQIKQR